MKILLISDTHEQHGIMYSVEEAIAGGDIDLVIHAGDGSNPRNPAMNQPGMLNCLEWLESLGVPVIYSPGNHDTSIEAGMIDFSVYKNVKVVIHDTYLFKYTDLVITPIDDIPGAAKGEEVTKVLKIFCSPYTPTFGTGWAYNVDRDKIGKYWDEIPEDTDILVTHGPPYGILDKTGYKGANIAAVGCTKLLHRIHHVVPKLHVFGHIHTEDGCFNHGKLNIWGIDFVNASMVDLSYTKINNCIIYEI